MMEVPTYKYGTIRYETIYDVGHIVKRGKAKSSGNTVYVLVTDEDKYATANDELRRAVMEDRVVYVEVYPDGKTAIQIHTKPFLHRGKINMLLHMKHNDIWRMLHEQRKPVIVKFVIKARGGEPS